MLAMPLHRTSATLERQAQNTAAPDIFSLRRLAARSVDATLFEEDVCLEAFANKLLNLNGCLLNCCDACYDTICLDERYTYPFQPSPLGSLASAYSLHSFSNAPTSSHRTNPAWFKTLTASLNQTRHVNLPSTS